MLSKRFRSRRICFNTQPPEGGWLPRPKAQIKGMVSTHSRLKAAGLPFNPYKTKQPVSTHSRLKAAGTVKKQLLQFYKVSTHSRLKAAGPSMG